MKVQVREGSPSWSSLCLTEPLAHVKPRPHTAQARVEVSLGWSLLCRLEEAAQLWQSQLREARELCHPSGTAAASHRSTSAMPAPDHGQHSPRTLPGALPGAPDHGQQCPGALSGAPAGLQRCRCWPRDSPPVGRSASHTRLLHSWDRQSSPHAPFNSLLINMRNAFPNRAEQRIRAKSSTDTD